MIKLLTSAKNWFLGFSKSTKLTFEDWKKIKIGVATSVIAAVIFGIYTLGTSFWGSPDEQSMAVSTDWGSVKHTTDRDRIAEFIAEYHGSPFAALARGRLRIADEWLSIRSTNSLDELRAFQRRHRDPPFRQLAAERIEQLEDQADWERAQLAGHADAYRSYLAAWSDGTYRQAAQDKLRELDDADWNAARAGNSLEAVQDYLRKWRNGKNASEARRRLAQLQERRSWDEAHSRDSISSYDSYLSTWPKGRHVAQAKARLAELREAQAWLDAEKADNASAYKNYLATWQSGPHRREARDRLRELDRAAWQDADHAASIQSYQGYMETWPDGTYRRMATARIDQLKDDEAWQEALSFDTVFGYRSYLEEPRNRRHKAKAQDKLRALDDAAWQLAERENALSSYRHYMDNWRLGRHHDQALRKIRGFDQQAWDFALKSNTVPGYNGYLTKWPNGEHVAKAKANIDRLLNPPPTNCDRLAANPADPAKPNAVYGTLWRYMEAGQAIKECDWAVRQYPNVARFRYQLARAYHRNGQAYLAVPMYQRLISEGYVAAFDNLGWLYFSGRGVPKDIEKAIEHFLLGSKHGSRESMTSLGEMYLHTKQHDKARHWFEKARNLGDKNAEKYLADLDRQKEYQIPPQVQELGTALITQILQKALDKQKKK